MLGFGFQLCDGAVVDDAAQGLFCLEGVVLFNVHVREQNKGLGDPILVCGELVRDVEHLVLRLIEFALFEGAHCRVISALCAKHRLVGTGALVEPLQGRR